MMKNKVAALAALVLLCFTLGTEAQAGAQWNTDNYDLYPGDFDGDGKTDLLYIAKSPSGESGIARSDNTGGPNTGWQTWLSNYLGIPWHSNLYRVLVGDFNDDGRSDLFLQRSTPGDHYVLLANTSGKFTMISQTVPNSHLDQVWSGDQHKVHVGNFDGVGGDDLFLQGARPANEHAVFLSDASGQFASASPQHWFDSGWTAFNWSAQHSNIFVGDFDGNGSSDLLVQGKPTITLIDFDVAFPIPTYGANIFGVALSQGGTTPFQQSGIRQWSRNKFGADWSPQRGNVVVGDFNGDGVSDVLFQARTSSATSLLLLGIASSSGDKFAAATAAGTNVDWSAGGYRLIAGNFDGSGGAGVYWQAQGSGATNYVTNSIGNSVSAPAHSPVQPSGVYPTTSVGRTAGSFAVSSVGAATYNVPLWMPPGPRGMQPNLSLTYDSNAGNGVLGVGWSLTGLSSIERCNRSLGQDGETGGVTLTVSDRFCLNGQRLQLIAGSNATDGSKYGLEIDNFSTVTAVGTLGAGPDHFTMRDRDGISYEFGNTADSRVAADDSTTPFRWKLNKVFDQAGNSYVVTYSKVTGFAIPASISWSPTAAAGSSYQYTAVFSYMNTRTSYDTVTGYVGNSQVSNNRRLESVQVQSSTNGISQTVRKYVLGYDISPRTQRSRLTSIQECADDSLSACLAPTAIAYQDGATIVTSGITGGNASSQILKAPRDFNGDGRDDLLYVSGGSWHVAFATEGGFSVPRNTSIASGAALLTDRFVHSNQDALLASSGGVWYYYVWNEAAGSFSSTATNAPVDAAIDRALADTNGDGLSDLVWAGTGNQIYIRRNVSALGATMPSFEATAQLAATLPSTKGNFLAFRNGEWQGARRHDFDGDGKQDLVVLSKLTLPNGPNPERYNSTPLLARGSTFEIANSPLTNMLAVPDTSGGVNFNDDACTDRVHFSSVYIEKCGSNPAGLVTLPGQPNLVMDWDGDGRSDFLFESGGYLVVYRSLGSGGVGPAEATGILYSAGTYFSIDQDGDGLADVIHVASAAPNALTFYKRTGSGGSTLLFDLATPDLAVSFTDGFDVNYSPGYVSTARSSYTEPAIDIPGLAFMDSSRTVVGQVTASNGSGGAYNRTYEYVAGRINIDRYDFAGFEQVKEIDLRTNLVRKTTYEQLFPLVGLVKKSELLQANGSTPIQVTTNSNEKFDYTFGGAHKRYFAYLHIGETKQYEFLGAQNGQLLSTATTTNTFDVSTGALTDSTSEVVEEPTANGLQNGVKHTAEVHISLFNDVGNSCLGRPQNVQQKRRSTIAVTGAEIVRNNTIIWEGAYCRPDYSIAEPGDSRWQVTTDYGYDGFGNVNSVTETPIPVAAHVPQQTARTTTINWGATGQFPTVVTNPLSQSTTYGWSRALGVMTRETDPNGISTYRYPDVFGRIVQETWPDGTRSEQRLTACNAGNSYCSGASDLRLLAQNYIYDNSGALVRSDAEYFDRFEKLRYDDQQLLSGSVSRVITTYDSLGRVSTQSVPHTSGGPLGNTTYVYDDLGRLKSVKRPVSETDPGEPLISVSYLGLRQEVTDSRAAPSRTSTQIRDALGRVVRSLDAANSATNYAYDAFGNLRTVTDAAQNITALTYNQLGWKLESVDPDMGHWYYDYYPMGELRWQKDANLKEVTFEYDKLSRLTARHEQEGTTNFYFDGAAHGIGQMHNVEAPGGYKETFAYDIAGRPSQRSIEADAATYNYIYNYNAAGLLDTLTYPASTSGSPFKVQYGYQYGINNSVRSYVDNSPGTVYWQATSNVTNARGQFTDEQYGNGLRTRSTYDLISGLLKDRKTGPGVSQTVQNLAFTWYANEQLDTRSDNNQSLTEKFHYDSLGRLDYSELNGSQNLNVDYDAIGNITAKSGVGDYKYEDATKKHAVSRITVNNVQTHSYTYDYNGNMLTRDGAQTDWFTYNQPQTVRSATATSIFSYTHDRQRWKQQISGAGGSETVTYIGELFEKRVVGSDIEYRHLVVAGNGQVAYVERNSGSTSASTYYVSSDHLGGTSVITDAAGAVVVRESFDAFGQRRGSNWTGVPTTLEMTQIATTTRRGFTFHEHLDNLNLVHMNGRVFDPMLGRFTSADPYVQAPFNGQSLNRYSYTFNDPLANVDPSGFSCWHYESSYQGPDGGVIQADRHDTCDDWWYGDWTWPGGDASIGGGSAGILGTDSIGVVQDGTAGGSCANGNGACHRAPLPPVDIDWAGIANDWWPGYQIGTCIYDGCSGGKWILGIVGAWPGGKAGTGTGLIARSAIGARSGKTVIQAFSVTTKEWLRIAARDIWRTKMGKSAAEMGLEVHHRIPLEWSHLFPNLDPNRTTNLIGLPGAEHWRITAAWNQWRVNLGARTPTHAEIEGFAVAVDSAFSDVMTRLP